jgi:hypothetical protein
MPLKTSTITLLCEADLEKEQMTYRGGGSLAGEETDWPRAASGFLPIGWAASGSLLIGWAGGPATVRISEAASFQFLLITMSAVAASCQRRNNCMARLETAGS